MNYIYIFIVILMGLIISCKKAEDATGEEKIILATSFEKPSDSTEDTTTKESFDSVESEIESIDAKIDELRPKITALRNRVETIRKEGPDSMEKRLKAQAALEDLRKVVKQLQDERALMKSK